MKRYFKFLGLVILFLASYLQANSYTKEELNYIKNTKVKVALLPDFPPFSIYKNSKLSGYSYDTLELISKKSGLNFEYEVNKWPKNLQKFKNGQVNVIDAISYRKERLSFTNYTKPYYEVPLVIFSRKDLNSYSNLHSLKGKKLGLTKNIFYKKQIEDLNIFEIVEYDSFEDKLNALAFGEVDIIFGHLLSTQIAIKNSGFTNMKVLGNLELPNLRRTDLRFGINKDNKILSSIFMKTFDSITIQEWRVLHEKWISVYTNSNNYSKNTIYLNKKEKEFLKTKKISCIQTDLWPPFNFFKEGKRVGLSYDYWNLITKKAGIDFECKRVSTFPLVLKQIKNKNADLTISTTITEDTMSYGLFSKPYISFPIAIVTNLDKRYISQTSSLNGKKVAVGRSYSAYKILRQKYPNIDFVEVDNTYEALELLSKEEVFAVVDILPVLSYLIEENGFGNIKIAGVTEFDFDVRIMVRNDYDILVPILNKAIDSINGKEKKEILNKWLSVRYENIVDYKKYWPIFLIFALILMLLVYRQYILNKHNKKLQEAKAEIENKTLELLEKTLELNRLTNTLEERIKEEVRKNEEQTKQLIQQSRLAQMGEMISMIAHQWRQPLTAISATTNSLILKLMLDEKVDKKEFSKEITLIGNYSQYLSLTIDDFRNFFKKDKSKIDIAIEEVIESSISIVSNSLKSNEIKLKLDYNANRTLKLYASEVSQVILNILTNAQDAFLEKQIKNKEIRIRTFVRDFKTFVLIEDNAGGIKEEILERIFEPYFSTKENKEGSGIGLYMSKTIIKDHCKGELRAYNNSLGGATFEIELPMTYL